MDPDFAYGVALAKIGGRRVLRLAEADVLPFEFTAVDTAVATTWTSSKSSRTRCGARPRATTRRSSAGPSRPSHLPTRRACRPRARSRCRTSTSRRCRTRASGCSRRERLRQGARERGRGSAGRGASRGERDPDAGGARAHAPAGLAGRPWFRHHVYAPGFYTGYGVKTLPPCARRSRRGAGRTPRRGSRSRPRCSRLSRARSSGPPRRSLPLAEGRPALTSKP